MQTDQTPIAAFIETAALFAVMNGDVDRAKAGLAELNATEATIFLDQLDQLHDLVEQQVRTVSGRANRARTWAKP